MPRKKKVNPHTGKDDRRGIPYTTYFEHRMVDPGEYREPWDNEFITLGCLYGRKKRARQRLAAQEAILASDDVIMTDKEPIIIHFYSSSEESKEPSVNTSNAELAKPKEITIDLDSSIDESNSEAIDETVATSRADESSSTMDEERIEPITKISPNSFAFFKQIAEKQQRSAFTPVGHSNGLIIPKKIGPTQ